MDAHSNDVPANDFAGMWTTAATIPGWLTRDQGAMLYRYAARLPRGARLLEIGSHQGRSTVILATAARGLGGEVVAIDPFVEGRLFGGAATGELFVRHLEQAGVSDVVRHVADYSTRVRPGWSEPIDYLYIDGKHDYWTFSDDLRWRRHLPMGASILVHDAFSSLGVTLGILVRVLFSRDLRYVNRTGSLALFEHTAPTRADRFRIVREMPWWLRNLVIKVLLRLRLRPITRLLGHDSPFDPY